MLQKAQKECKDFFSISSCFPPYAPEDHDDALSIHYMISESFQYGIHNHIGSNEKNKPESETKAEQSKEQQVDDSDNQLRLQDADNQSKKNGDKLREEIISVEENHKLKKPPKITKKMRRRRQKQGLDIVNQILTQSMKIFPTQNLKQFIKNYKKSRLYLLMGLGHIMKSNNQSFIDSFWSIMLNLIKQKRLQINGNHKYGAGLKYLFNLELDCVEQVLEVFFGQQNFGLAIQIIYMNERAADKLENRTIRQLRNTCQKFNEIFQWPVSNKFYQSNNDDM